MPTHMPQTSEPRAQEGGFALILAILSLLLLTFLGLTLAATTTTELQIAANQRWGQQARYNAEAGLQAAQIILRDIANQDAGSLALAVHQVQPPPNEKWTDSAPLPPTATPPPPPRPGPAIDLSGAPARQFENHDCAAHNGRAGYGNVLADRTGTILYQNVTNLFGQNLNGSVTIWVRRPLQPNPDGTIQHDGTASRIVVTAEGTAPYVGDAAVATSLRRRQQAVRVMEIALALNIPEENCDLSETTQQGLGSEGANFARCVPVDGFMGRADSGGQ